MNFQNRSFDEIIDLSSDDDEYVRPPDHVVREQLISFPIEQYNNGGSVFHQPSFDAIVPDTDDNMRELRITSESEMEAVLETSRREYNDEMEKYCMEVYEAEKKLRENRFMNVRRVIERIMRIDKSNIREYEMLLNAFTLYEDGYTEHYIVEDETMYTRIMFLLKSLRITPGEYEDLKSFICY